MPFIAKHKEENSVIDQSILITRHALLLFAIGVSSFTILFAPWLQQLLYHSEEAYNVKVMQWCIASLPGYFLVHIYGSVLTATGRFRDFIMIMLVSVMLNIVLNLFLIPSYGALGCCYAAVASQYCCGILSSIVTIRRFKLKAHIHPR